MTSTSTTLDGVHGRCRTIYTATDRRLLSIICQDTSSATESSERQLLWQGNLEGVTAAKLDSFRAQLWMLAPPCQPFTRRGLQQDTADARSSSFQHILSLLPDLKVVH